MDKDETIKKLADSLLLMVTIVVGMSSGTPKGKAIDEAEVALFEATQHGWKNPALTRRV